MSDNTGILIVVEIKDGIVPPIAGELFGAAKIISNELNPIISVVAIRTTTNTNASAAASILETAIKQSHPAFVLLGETDLGRDLAPLLAGRLNSAAVTDVVALRVESGAVIATRPVYGGNALADIAIETEPQIISIRPKSFAPVAIDESRVANIIELPDVEPAAGVRVLEHVIIPQQGPKIEEAKIVVGGGRGLGGLEGFAQLKQLAHLLGGVVGASRPPCDQGWWPESGQIGVTGKIISPDLYIAVGISGSSQHVSGVSGTKTVVAINKDAEANIFKVATYGVVADWKKVIPAFTAKVKELTGR